MANNSWLARLLTLVVITGVTAVSSSAQEAEPAKPAAPAAEATPGGEDTKKDEVYQDKSPEQINVEQMIRRRRDMLLAQQWITEGEQSLKEKKHKDAIDKFTQAEVLLKQISKSTPSVTQDLDVVRKRLADTYHQYAIALIEQAKEEVNIEHFERAKQSIAKAIDYDPTFKPEAQRLLDKIAQLRLIIEVEQRTKPSEIDPEYRERVKEIMIKKAEGQVFADHSVWKRARNAYEDVLLKNPADEEAINALDHLYADLRDAAKRRRRAQEQERMAEIEWKWIDPIPPRESSLGPTAGGPTVAGPKDTGSGNDVHAKLKSIIITKISFEDTPVSTVFEFLKTRSRELDPEGVGVNFLPILRPTGAAGAGPGAAAHAAAGGAKPPAAEDVGGDLVGGEGGEVAPPEKAPGADASGWQEPTITMDFDNIPLGEAVRYICEGAGLRYKVEEHAIVILGPEVSRDNLELRFFPVDPRLLAGNKEGKEGAEAAPIDYQKYFEDKGVTFPTSPNGEKASISYDRGTSQLIVRNSPDNLNLIDRILKQINIQIPQVTIEAKFIEVRQNTLEELSFQWLFLGSPAGNPKNFQVGGADFALNPGALANTTRNISQLGSVFDLDTIIGHSQFNTLIYFFNRQDGTDVMSAPKVTVQSGKEAYISMIEERRFPESFEAPTFVVNAGGNGGNTVTYNPPTPVFGEPRQDLGVTLTVTPQVAGDGISISLELHPKVVEFIRYDTTFNTTATINGEPVELRYDTPIFEVRELRTEVTVWDGETVVLGGSIKDTLQKLNDKIPIIADLPLIGRLFQSKGEISEKKNLLMFVSARIIDPSGLPRREHDIRGVPDFRR